ncbi:tryptophan synthase subunit beta [Niameybacter massiliensis]|uniref:Tryptophan synthase beta chain n=1 Tax=Holtiella tumoricola TaxID=3018743 RepID=A0AA42J0Z3_9FIRM|nr:MULTISPECIES: tryptophan synthase subunit beta [Lachnospirales]MDA3731763.1 tryptophan synthase subunit beta [Holtiella tumoricola]
MLKDVFGNFGGAYVPEAQLNALKELEQAFVKYKDDEAFKAELNYYLHDYVGRESPLYYAENLTKACGGAKIYLKREDLNHTGAHKINNVLGQMLLAKRMGKKKVIAETGAGQHGVATATVAALMGMECTVYMGKEDMKRQALNVFRMEMLGAKVVPATSGTQTLKEAVDEAICAWVNASEETFYVLGSAVGPHPYPTIVKHFQQVISEESRRQILDKEGQLPCAIIACVGGGSNAIGSFAAYIDDPEVALIGVEAAGKGLDTPMHAATITKGEKTILHGMKTLCVLDENKEVAPVYSISPGLDYPGVGPEHAYLNEIGRATYVSITDDEAVEALLKLCKYEGILPAIESSHALAYALKYAPTCKMDESIIVTVSGRGDKDVEAIAAYLNK